MILAWLVAEDDGARKKMRDVLADRDESFDDISASLQGASVPVCVLCADADWFSEQLNSMDVGAGSDDPVMKDVLNALIQHLD